MTIETEADELCEAGHKAGQSILSAIDDAYEGRSILPARKMRRVFDAMVEGLTDEMSAIDAPLFIAAAYGAFPIVNLSAVERAEIQSNEWSAYDTFLRERASEAMYERADFLADQRRDERAA
jgi:hypothetical protein